MKVYFKELFRGCISLLKGLGVTVRALVSAPVTVQYPREKLSMQQGFRGHPVLVRDQESGRFRCIACGTCMKACPSGCISVTALRREGERRASPDHFVLDFTRCSLCGTCVEVCPVNGLAFSHTFAVAGRSKEEFVLNLMQRFEDAQ